MRINFIVAKYARHVEVAIAAKGLEVRFGDVIALTGVTLEVPVGASLAIVGANGSGKSTFLGALAGLLKPASGTAYVLDGPPSFVLQATEVDDSLPVTVRDVVGLARYPRLGLFRRFQSADKHAVATALGRMHVADLANKPLHHLSGGQHQRVLMAQGLAQDSRVLLLDEPMTALDVTSRRVVLDVMKEEVAGGRTVVMTTHSMADAREADLVLLLDTSPVGFGPPDQVLTEPNLVRAFGDRVMHVGDDIVVDDHHVH